MEQVKQSAIEGAREVAKKAAEESTLMIKKEIQRIDTEQKEAFAELAK